MRTVSSVCVHRLPSFFLVEISNNSRVASKRVQEGIVQGHNLHRFCCVNRYASCGLQWHGLSLLDYALLAELAYFDQNDPEVCIQPEINAGVSWCYDATTQLQYDRTRGRPS